MQNLMYKIRINASPEKVWKCLWEPDNYKKWTKVFSEGSYYKTDSFTQGNKIHLLTPKGDGMYSVMDAIVENELLVFRHLGEIINFEEQFVDEKTRGWASALESYELKPVENGTELTVQVETIDQYIDSMNKTFPLALQELKKIAES